MRVKVHETLQFLMYQSNFYAENEILNNGEFDHPMKKMKSVRGGKIFLGRKVTYFMSRKTEPFLKS